MMSSIMARALLVASSVRLLTLDVSAEWLREDGRWMPVHWATYSGQSAIGHYYRPDNYELLIKEVDACELAGERWLFLAGATERQVRFVVSDSRTGAERAYMTEPGPFVPIQDSFHCSAEPPYVHDDAPIGSYDCDTGSWVGVTHRSGGQEPGRYPSEVWNLDRIDQRGRLLDGQPYDPPGDGEGVHIYIVDTGIDLDHDDFAGRIGLGVDLSPTPSPTPDDFWGHGTHVAGVAAGTKFGIAKGATLHPVKVFSQNDISTGEHTSSALRWIRENLEMPAVVNMSLEGDPSTEEAREICMLIGLGVPVVVAAGNRYTTACNYSPAAVWQASTVAAIDRNDEIANFSNFGVCTNITAPGKDVLSDWRLNGERAYSGTSMAAPHVTGWMAVCLGLGKDPYRCVYDEATVGSIQGGKFGTPDRILYTERKQ